MPNSLPPAAIEMKAGIAGLDGCWTQQAPSRLERGNGRIRRLRGGLAKSRCRSGVGSWLILDLARS
jgi:hypothetical protein